MPQTFLDHPGPIPFAHRGGALDAPENSLAAFEAAVELGYRYVETDVHVTADGVVIAFHDRVLDRVTDRVGSVARMRWDDIREARIEGVGQIPTLEELLTRWPHLRCNIDPKCDAVVEPLIEVLRRCDAVERVCVGSFSDRRIRRVARALGPRLCTGMGPRAVGRLQATSLGARLGRVPGNCAQVPATARGVPFVTKRFVDAAHGLDKVVHVWTVDDADEMHRLLDLGVDGLMTDRPATLRSVLEERNCWF